MYAKIFETKNTNKEKYDLFFQRVQNLISIIYKDYMIFTLQIFL